MARVLKILAWLLFACLLLAILGAASVTLWYVHSKLPVRDGSLVLNGLQAPVSVQYDERGVPHIRASNAADLYRALGYVHAQDRLFQMEMVRRLAQGELAEVLGPKLIKVDQLFRTVGLRQYAAQAATRLNPTTPTAQALLAYLDGINQFQDAHPPPLEFDLLHIKPRPFTVADCYAVSGYLAYSFATALRSEPALTAIRDQLGEPYLKVFDLEWHPQGVFEQPSAEPPEALNPLPTPQPQLSAQDSRSLTQLATVSREVAQLMGMPTLEGSNAWVIAGSRTASGKPFLAGDPHIGFSVPAVWYEAHLSSPGFDLYGHFQALFPFALLGHNHDFGWSLTMLLNDDMDLVAEHTNPANPNQVAFHQRWIDMEVRQEVIHVRGGKDVTLTLRRSPHGPLITDAFADSLGPTPVAMWWTFLETDNSLLDAFYELNRADTLAKSRDAATKISAPGLNILWASASGDIAWWAAAKAVIRPDGVNPAFILDGSNPESDKLGYYRFDDNPQEINPKRGYIVSANNQPLATSGVPLAGYYKLPDRVQRLDSLLRNDNVRWDMQASRDLQLDSQSAYAARVMQPLLPILNTVVTDPLQHTLLESLYQWDGSYGQSSITPTVFTQFVYELAHATMADEMDEQQFKNLLGTPALEEALPRLAADPDSPWWDDVNTKEVETREDILKQVWQATYQHLQKALGGDPTAWGWGNAHTLTHTHPLATQWPLNWLFNVGPFPVAGGREMANNMSAPIGPAPWAVKLGPSTRRLIDFGDPSASLGINPVGQSGVWGDAHYKDQAETFANGGYLPQHLDSQDVKAHAQSMLRMTPP